MDKRYTQAAKTALRILRETAPARGQKITDPEAAALVVAAALAEGRLDVENVGLILLDPQNRVISCEIVTQGTVNQAPIYPRLFVKAAILADASALILWHNHPGGQCSPSYEDMELTRSLKELFEKLDIRLHDHLIIADGRIWSIVGGREVDPLASKNQEEEK